MDLKGNEKDKTPENLRKQVEIIIEEIENADQNLFKRCNTRKI